MYYLILNKSDKNIIPKNSFYFFINNMAVNSNHANFKNLSMAIKWGYEVK